MEKLSPGDDGTLAVVFRDGGRRTLAIADEEGRLVQLSRAPTEARTGGCQRNSRSSRGSGSRRVWESLDGGSSWEPVGRLPLDICPGDSGCNVPLSCTPFGCTLGDELSRVGWRGQGDDDMGVLAPTRGKARRLLDRRVRQAISCTLDEAGWMGLGGLDQPPNANQAAIGKLAWYGLVRDFKTASARIISSRRGNKGRLDTRYSYPP